MTDTKPRVPVPATAHLLGTERRIQMNHCRVPSCENFGVPARHEPGGRGPSPDRDMRYKVHSTKKGQVPSIRCNECKDNPPMKSNTGIVAETERLIESGGLRTIEESLSCRNTECGNTTKPIGAYPKHYRKRGMDSRGGGQSYQCCECGRRISASDPVRLHRKSRDLAADVFSRIANKSPVRGVGRGARLGSVSSYYEILDFIHRQCRGYSGRVDRALIEGRKTLPPTMTIENDAQEYTINWESRLDRRNVVLSSYCTVDSKSRFVLGMHANFDGRVDPFHVVRDATAHGDFEVPEAFRRYAQYWLPGDDFLGGRALGKKIYKHDRVELLRQIRAIYEGATTRRDVEDIEIHHHDASYRMPGLRHGVQVHLPYTAYAHWMLLHRILSGAGVRYLQANMDINSMSRSAFLCAFVEEVGRGDAHAFFVRYTKFQTVDQRRRILEDARRKRAAVRATLPEEIRDNPLEVARHMMRERIELGQTYGKWNDEWIDHPIPAMNEPRKAVSWLTPTRQIEEARRIDMFLDAGLARIDNIFMKSRRLFSALERPVGTSSGHNKVWHGYAPYNPGMLEKYLVIFRCVQNFMMTGDDHMTPAMRLGFAKRPLTYEDILWLGEGKPKMRRRRRRGRGSAV